MVLSHITFSLSYSDPPNKSRYDHDKKRLGRFSHIVTTQYTNPQISSELRTKYFERKDVGI